MLPGIQYSQRYILVIVPYLRLEKNSISYPFYLKQNKPLNVSGANMLNKRHNLRIPQEIILGCKYKIFTMNHTNSCTAPFLGGPAARSDTVADSKDCGTDAALPVLREGQGGTDVSLKIRWKAVHPSDNVFLFVLSSPDNSCVAF